MQKIGFFLLLTVLIILKANSQTFTNVNFQGMGFVVGMKIHPTETSLKFLRTDVGGIYRFDNTNAKWSAVSDGQLESYQIVSLALDPTNSNNAWLIAGGTENNKIAALYKSTDKGTTWSKSSTFPATIYGSGNSSRFRWSDNRLVIDSNNGGKLMLFGSEKNGLWKSTNAGLNWSQVSNTVLPFGPDSTGGHTFVAIDKNSGNSTTSSTTFYVGVVGNGVYKTTDGGNTFNLIAGIAASDKPVSGSLASNGTLYVITSNQTTEWTLGTSGKVYKYSGTGSFVDITPTTKNSTGFCGLDVDPTNPNRIITMQWTPGNTNGIHVSTNGGSSWSQPTFSSRVEPSWYPSSAAWTYSSFVLFDRINLNQTWLGTGYAVYKANDITLSTPTWTAITNNLEEMCVGIISVPPAVGGPALYTAQQDKIGFCSVDKKIVPSSTAFASEFGIGTGLDYCAANPNVVAIVGSTENAPINSKGRYTIDGGKNWSVFPSFFTDAHNGNIAISATDENNWVWIPDNYGGATGTPNYTTNKGISWTAGTGIPVISNDALLMWAQSTSLVSDKVAAGTFYYYLQNDGTTWGNIYKSTNNGASWSKTYSGLDSYYLMRLKAVPGKQGHIFFFTKQSSSHLMLSTDGASTFTAFANITNVRGIGFGKAISPSIQPTVYMAATINGVSGLYFSTDYCNTWTEWSANKLPFALISDISGDMREEQLVYISTIGRGILYTYAGRALPNTPVTSVSINSISTSFMVGDTPQLTAKVLPLDATNTNVIWSSLNPNIASVSATGLVTCLAVGYDTIRVTTQDGNLVANYPINVSPFSVQIEAESYSAMFGVTVSTCPEGGSQVGSTDVNDYMDYVINIPHTGTYNFDYRLATPYSTGKIQVRTVGGTILSSDLTVPTTGGWSTYSTVSTTINFTSTGTQTIRVFISKGVNGGTFNLNWYKIYDNIAPTVPSGLNSSNITDSGCTLTWTASTDNVAISYYEVFKDGVSIGTTSTNSYNITNLNPGTNYSFSVKAIDTSGNTSIASGLLGIKSSNKITTEIKSASTENLLPLVYTRNKKIIIDLSETSGIWEFYVINANGIVVKTITVNSSNIVPIEINSNGLYLIRIKNAVNQSVQKLIIV